MGITGSRWGLRVCHPQVHILNLILKVMAGRALHPSFCESCSRVPTV